MLWWPKCTIAGHHSQVGPNEPPQPELETHTLTCIDIDSALTPLFPTRRKHGKHNSNNNHQNHAWQILTMTWFVVLFLLMLMLVLLIS